MEVIKFLKANGSDFQKLTEAFGIKVKDYPGHKLVVLNYDQINSPKMEPIVQECRGLILDYELNIVCRPFDRFFNYGEADTDKLNLTGYTYFPKLDGSLIKVYYWNNSWRIATRGTAFAESDVGGWAITFEELVLKAAGCLNLAQFSRKCNVSMMNPSETYLFELTAMENRVVTRYDSPSLTLLSVRDNQSGEFAKMKYEISLPQDFYNLNPAQEGLTIQEILEKADNLKNLEEGFVGYDKEGVPRVKVKSAAYVKIHYLRSSTSLTKKSVCDVIATGEMGEYLIYYPEDSKYFKEVLESWDKHLQTLTDVFADIKDLDSQKDFAILAKDLKCCALLFEARKKGTSVTEVFTGMDTNTKVRLMMEVV